MSQSLFRLHLSMSKEHLCEQRGRERILHAFASQSWLITWARRQRGQYEHAHLCVQGQSSQARDESSQEPSDQQRSTADIIAVSPSTSSDTSTDGGAASGEEEGQCSAAPPQSNSMSPSPRAVVPSPAHRHQQVDHNLPLSLPTGTCCPHPELLWHILCTGINR